MVMFELVISLLAPHTCLGCGSEGHLICSWCHPEVFIPLPSRCCRCKRLTKEFAVCKSCRSSLRLRRVWVATAYDGVAKQLVTRYKFGRARAAAKPIALALDETLPYLPPATIITFVPTATTRLRQRGYDQAELIATELARRRGLKCRRLITRLSQTRQVGAAKRQRERQLAGAFVVTRPLICQGGSVLVVDDVITTGSTLEAIAQVLRDSGAAHVDAAVFAQKA